MVSKLKVIKLETVPIKENDPPVDNLQEETANGYRSVIFGAADVS